jgi:hypothetical protein
VAKFVMLTERFVVVACDGLHSKARRLILGEDNPAARPSFAHKVAYRAIVPIAESISALGEDKANNQCAHMGPDAHTLSFPVSMMAPHLLGIEIELAEIVVANIQSTSRSLSGHFQTFSSSCMIQSRGPTPTRRLLK